MLISEVVRQYDQQIYMGTRIVINLKNCASILLIWIWSPLPKGRAIRHRGDYSSIVLCDRRYSRPATLSKLPTWIKDRTSTHQSFGPAFAALRKVRSTSTYTCKSVLWFKLSSHPRHVCILCVSVLPGEKAKAGVASFPMCSSGTFNYSTS